MGNTSSMLTQYDIEEVEEHCNHTFSQQEIVSLYQRFCQLDRSGGGFISADEFLSVPEFAVNPLSQVLNLYLSLSLSINIENLDLHLVVVYVKHLYMLCTLWLLVYYVVLFIFQRLLRMLDGLNFKEFVAFLSAFSSRASLQQKIEFIFKVYDTDCNGKVTAGDLLNILRDLTGQFISEQQREQVLTRVLEESGYAKDASLTISDFMKILGNSDMKMEVEVPVD
ncbi:hypothetical protein FEM48_Zijuj01G0169100 [Ziziphus jujuba var. spinosa]|uniref:EF-hand domain-containing protein n=1 Tax=Ziziphus jujuba var. spinosa TaxID=714518 RepID=A0A978W2F7_ZIZJJ|nr:hypothetical protein FEM48_Zijuj01G0169100 [Ziziphus jujuba var. spinosa]